MNELCELTLCVLETLGREDVVKLLLNNDGDTQIRTIGETALDLDEKW